ncbi:MAG: hypothetical protein NTU53_17465 [Planctomycetota bacterium]|nr:hypothetical protein [Planctomycetota bacterium]
MNAEPDATNCRAANGSGLCRMLVFLLIGGAVSVLVAWVLAVCLEIGVEETGSSAGVEHDRMWSLTAYDRFGAMRLVSLRQHGANWSPHQATGQPDATGGRDDVAAWASLTQDAQREWLVLTYPQAVVPRVVRICESYCPGAVDAISVFDESGKEHEVWRGTDPTAGQTSGVSEIAIATEIKTTRVKIHVNSVNVPGWNEIDAVGLVDEEGRTWWAVEAEASSTYAYGSVTTSSYASVWPLVPPWGGLRQPLEAFKTGLTNHEKRMVEGFGWPMLAMWGEREISAGGPGVPYGLVSRNSGFRSFVVNVPPTARGKLPAMLPLRPIWTGLAVDVVFYGVVAWAVVWLSVKPRRFYVEVSRMRHGSCLQCGYQLNYDFVAGCPECGWRRGGER